MMKIIQAIFLCLMLLNSFHAAYAEETNIEQEIQAELTETETAQVNTEPETEAEETPLNLATIDVSGVTDELKKNIELHMPVTIPECTAERGDVRQFFDTVKKNLRKATRALGYYDAEFTSGGSIVEDCWKLRLKVEPVSYTHLTLPTIYSV